MQFEQLGAEGQKALDGLLQPTPTPEEIENKLNALKNSLIKIVDTNHVLDEVNTIIGNDDDLRKSCIFPVSY